MNEFKHELFEKAGIGIPNEDIESNDIAIFGWGIYKTHISTKSLNFFYPFSSFESIVSIVSLFKLCQTYSSSWLLY